MTPETQRRRHRVIAGWLFAVAAMVFAMVVIGGLTRLTHSGLSMVDWRPITGWLPPLGDAEWEAAFAAYRQYPEYREINAGMTLAEFKGIFWLEYIHRLWGRLLGLAFGVPLAAFALMRWIDRPLAARLGALFVLGALQGGLGWYMVKSGLVDRPDVSPYRLTAHLGLAIVIYGALVWTALGLVRAPPTGVAGGRPWRQALGLWALVFVTVLSGGFVAGTDAGFAYNTFPTMDGEWLPDGLFAATPAWRSPFEDVTTVQFNHRLLAMSTLVLVVGYWAAYRRRLPAGGPRLAVDALAAAVALQVGLGIATLLLYVPVALGAAHQAGAMVLFTAALWAAFEVCPGRR